MITGIYVWFNYIKPSGSRASKIDWTGTADIDEAKKVVNKIKATQMLKKQQSNYFSKDVKLEITLQEIKTGKVLYRRTVA